MMAKRKHIPLFDDQLEILELLTDQEVGQAVLAAMRFMRSGAEADLTGGAGVVYQMLRAQFVRNQNDAAVGKKGGRPRKNPAEIPVSETETPVSEIETTKRNVTERNVTEQDVTEQDGTEQNITERNSTEGECSSAGGRFVPPTLDEVRAYVLQRRSPVEPQAFIDFYQARGWMVGKAPMWDWKAACRSAESWERWSRPPAQTQVTNPDRVTKYMEW